MVRIYQRIFSQFQLLFIVQRRVTKVPHLLKHLEYKERCIELQLCSLKYRRLRGDLIQQYKILNNIDIVNWHNQPLSRPPRDDIEVCSSKN